MKHVPDKVLLTAATGGTLGFLPGAQFWFSVVSIPLLMLFRWGYAYAPVFFGLIGMLILGGMFGAAWYVRHYHPEQDPTFIVIDRCAGACLALLGLHPVPLKFMIFGFIMFHGWLRLSAFAQTYISTRYVRSIKLVLLSTGEIILIAVFTNALLHFLWWVTH